MAMKANGRWRPAAALALVPMAGALAGACVDERARLGFSNWRAACRAAGFSPASLLAFTLELLPTALLGALLGGLAVQAAGILRRSQPGAANCSLAAHVGCAVAMIAGLLICLLPLSVPLLLGAEGLLAMGISVALFRGLERRSSSTGSPVEWTLA